MPLCHLNDSLRGQMIIAQHSGADIAPVDGMQQYGWVKDGHLLAIIDIKETPYVIEPHVTFMPWTKMRQKYEEFKIAMEFFSAHGRTVFLIVEKKHSDFYEQWLKRGLLRKVGVLDVPSANQEIHMYQYAREK